MRIRVRVVLLFLYPDRDPEGITSISLIFVLVSAAFAAIAHARKRVIGFRSALWFAARNLLGSIGGVLVAAWIPTGPSK